MPSSRWFFYPGDFVRKQCNLLLSALLAVCLVFSFPIEKAEAKSNGVLVVAKPELTPMVSTKKKLTGISRSHA